MVSPTTWKSGDLITAVRLNSMMLSYSLDDIQTNADINLVEGAFVIDSKGDLYQSQKGKAAFISSLKGPKGDKGDKVTFLESPSIESLELKVGDFYTFSFEVDVKSNKRLN